jgi:hypothetical protein
VWRAALPGPDHGRRRGGRWEHARDPAHHQGRVEHDQLDRGRRRRRRRTAAGRSADLGGDGAAEHPAGDHRSADDRAAADHDHVPDDDRPADHRGADDHHRGAGAADLGVSPG